MTRSLRAPARPDRTIPVTVARGPIPNESRLANDRRCGSGAAPPAAIQRGWVVRKISRVEARPTSQQEASLIRARQNRKALSVAFAIGGKFALRGFLLMRALFSRTAPAARQRRRAIRVARA